MRPTGILIAALVLLMATASHYSLTTETEDAQRDLRTAPNRDCNGNGNITCEGKVFYINPVHHVSSYRNLNVAMLMRNAVRHVSPYTANPISVLVYANANDRAQAIFDSLSGQPDISPVKTTNQNNLLSLSPYDVVIVHSNGMDFSIGAEVSVAEFAGQGGGVIGGHDVIWNQHNNPVLNEVFGAVANGDGSNPGSGWVKRDITVHKAVDHPVTAGIADSWNLIDEEYYFDVQFKREMHVMLEVNHSSNRIPVAWTLTLPDIEAPTNLTTQVIGDDIRLIWDNPNSSQVVYHLIYRAETPTSFDFANPLHDSSADANPRLETWVDSSAASWLAPREYYYLVRAVNTFGIASPTSHTAGKWTSNFYKGLNAFSLPLKPYMPTFLSWMANDIPGVVTLDWLDSSGRWVRYEPSSPNPGNDTVMAMGSTYQLVLSGQTDYTFVGYPGTMIRYMERMGNSTSFLENLTIDVQTNNVALSWSSVPGAISYHVYRSQSREDVLNTSRGPIIVTTGTSIVDIDILDGFIGNLFYAVVAEDEYCGLGSSTYSQGLVVRSFPRGVNSFALELMPVQTHSLDWYILNIEGVEGIAFVINSTWKFHADLMPPGVYDAVAELSGGYQISVKDDATSFLYLGE
jgi:type 1 glutamine amidotransferase